MGSETSSSKPECASIISLQPGRNDPLALPSAFLASCTIPRDSRKRAYLISSLHMSRSRDISSIRLRISSIRIRIRIRMRIRSIRIRILKVLV